MKVYIDNIPVVNVNSTLLKPKFTYRKVDETGDRAFSYSGDLEFTGVDYDYIYAQLKTSPNALINKVVLKFVDDCCSQNKVYEFYINHESLKWCEGHCELTAASIEKSISDEKYTCLKNKMIWDDTYLFKSKQHPRMSYCNELRPNWLGDLMIIHTLALYSAFLTMVPLLALIALIIDGINLIIQINNNIIDAINGLPGGPFLDNVDPIDLDGDPSTTTFQQFSNFIDSLLALGVGCGRKHPSPLVRDYAENVCKVCGLTFKSSILNNPANEYYNLVYVNAPINKGVVEADNSTYWIDENAPILSGQMFFDQLKVPFNAKWEIINSEVVFERHDYFVPKTPWLDLTTYDPTKIISVCWNWSRKPRYSYANLRYQKDGINWIGGEAIDRWGDYVQWNPQSSYSNLQKGAYEPLMPFAACRFRDDGIDRDILTFYEDQPTINTLILRYKNAMLMNSHNCYLPMLLIWDGQSRSNAFADKFTNIYFPALAGVVGANQYYNYPMWFKEGYPGNLYDRFHSIENPRTTNYQGLDVEIVIEFDCALLNAVDIDGVVKTIEGDTKEPLTVEINYENSTLTIKGTV